MGLYPVSATGVGNIPSLHAQKWRCNLLLQLVQALQTIDCLRFSAGTVKSLALAVFVLTKSAMKLPETAFKVFIMRNKA